MTVAPSGAPLVEPPTGEPVPLPSPNGRPNRRWTLGLGVAACGVAAAVVWAFTGNDTVNAPEEAVASTALEQPTDSLLQPTASAPPEPSAEPESPATDAPSTDPAPSTTAVVDSEATVAAGDPSDAAAADEPTLEDLQIGTDKLAEADEDDVLVLSLPTAEPVAPGELQPLTATIRGENVYLEGAAPSAEVALEYETQAVEIWGDQVVARYSIDASAPPPRADDVVLEKPVLFEPGSTTIDPEYLPVLDACFAFLNTYPTVSMVVEGHTDDVGSDQYNLQLAQERADAIVAYYESLGLEPERLVTVAAGESDPLADNATEEGRGENRRIDLSLVGALNARADDAEAVEPTADE